MQGLKVKTKIRVEIEGKGTAICIFSPLYIVFGIAHVDRFGAGMPFEKL
jgi:hypothetical protein